MSRADPWRGDRRAAAAARPGGASVGVPPGARTVLFLAVCCLGVSAIITQLTLMRELLSIFSGNELVFGIVLGNWMLLTGIGSALGKTAARLKHPPAALVLAQLGVAVLPILDVFLLRCLQSEHVQMRLLHTVLFIRGAEVGVTGTVVTCFLLLAPYCLITGYLLTLACLLLASRRDSSSIGHVYFLDVLGDVLGGLLFSFVLIYVFGHFGILYFPAALNLLFAGLVAGCFRQRLLLAATALLGSGLIALAAIYDLDDLSTRVQYAGQEVADQGNSRYGRLIVTESAGQYNFIFNGITLFSTHNLEEVEETVHYAMAQRPQAKRVLLISGGVSGTAREILKYDVDRVDYVELDPKIIEIARRFVPESLADGRINVVNTDGRLFVKQAPRQYEVVIVDVPDPSTSQINRFYTLEFFREVRRVLTAEGVLSFTLGHYQNHVSPELADLLAVGRRTLSEVFGQVLLIPDEQSGRVFFLASDGPLHADVADRLEQEGIPTRLISREYMRAVLAPARMADMRRAVAGEAPTNTDFSPVLYLYHLRFWMSKFAVRFGLLEAALLLLLLIYLVRMRPVSLAIFSTGFAASALEVVLLVGFQILYGCVYHRLGLIVTMFMLGLAVGSLAMNRLLAGVRRVHLAALELLIAAYAGCLPWGLIALGRLGGTPALVASQVAVPLWSLALGVLVGLEFPLAGKALYDRARGPTSGGEPSEALTAAAARLYTADYVGSALGALLVSTLLIPLIGVTAACLLVAALNLLSAGVILVVSAP